MKVAIVGAGVLGTSLGMLLQRAGHSLVALSSRTKRRAQAASTHLGGVEVVGDPGLAVMGADLVLLAVPDREIVGVAEQVLAGGALRRGAVVAHLAGGLPSAVLGGVRGAGAHAGAMHPLQTFADVDTAVRLLPSTYFFLEGDEAATALLEKVVTELGGRPVRIAPEKKALYHAGAAAASNYVVALVDYAVGLLVRAGVPEKEALPALLPLLQGTIANLEKVGLPKALTGPISRGDLGTVEAHLSALGGVPPELGVLYRALGRRTAEVARKQGGLTEAQLKAILKALQ